MAIRLKSARNLSQNLIFSLQSDKYDRLLDVVRACVLTIFLQKELRPPCEMYLETNRRNKLFLDCIQEI